MKRALALLLSASLTLSLAACGGGGGGTSQSGSSGTTSSDGAGELTATQQIIQEAQGMTLEELAQKAIEESNGQKFYGVGNSSRGATALPLFVEYLQSIDPSYTLEFEWQQPKNNKIFDQLTSDSQPDRIQDGPDRYSGHLHPQGLGGRQRHHSGGVQRLSASADLEQGVYV